MNIIKNALQRRSPFLISHYGIATTVGVQSVSRDQNVHQNHYDALGITPKATQSDVKTAYYKLSMIYHPDKNKGCNDAADRFRSITAAYEVLSNYRLRRLYDKGLNNFVL